MKRFLSMTLIISMLVCLASCGGKTSSQETPSVEETVSVSSTVETSTEVSSEEKTTEATDATEDDMSELKAIGDVDVENGILFVSITVPKDLVNEDTTQETLDNGAGDTYTSAKLNGDGSVTYKMTKAQHKAMLDKVKESIDESIQEMIEDTNYSISNVKYNDNMSEFDITLEGTELGFGDAFAAFAFYIYGGMYQIFSGKKSDKISVHFYDPSGNLIDTADSSKMGGDESQAATEASK